MATRSWPGKASLQSKDKTIGYGGDSESKHSVSRSGINTKNIQIHQDPTGELAKSVYTDITTETATQHSGSLKNVFDKDRVQQEIDLQVKVSQDFSRNIQAANGEINQYLDQLKTQREKGEISQSDYDTQVKNWQQGKVLLNMIASSLTAPTQSTAGIVAATASPALSYEIGQHFKGLAKENQLTGKTEQEELTVGQKNAHILAHAVLGAAVAAAGNNHALSGAISAGGAEYLAPKISQWLYDKEKGSDLTAEEKETVSAITNLLGATTGEVLGNSATDVASGSLLANNAVENNEFSLQDLGISSVAQHNLQQRTYQQVNQFVINSNSSDGDRNKLFELLAAYRANRAVTAEITAALVGGANIGITINADKSVTVTIAATAGFGVEGFVGLAASNTTRNDGVFSEVCSSIGAKVVVGGCAGAHLKRNEPLVVTGKMGVGATAFAGANIGIQKTFHLSRPQGSNE